MMNKADTKIALEVVPLNRTTSQKKIDATLYNDTWKSCCLVMDRRGVIFFSQLSISVMVMAFSIRQLIWLEDCNSQQTYTGLLTLCLGVWLPAPSMSI